MIRKISFRWHQHNGQPIRVLVETWWLLGIIPVYRKEKTLNL